MTALLSAVGQVLLLCALALVVDVLARLAVERIADWRYERRWARLTTSDREALLMAQVKALYGGRPVPRERATREPAEEPAKESRP